MSVRMQTPVKSVVWVALVLMAASVSVGHASRVPATDATRQVMPTVRITSPLGRTGTPATIRIVAQIEWPLDDGGRASTLHLVKPLVEGHRSLPFSLVPARLPTSLLGVVSREEVRQLFYRPGHA